MTRKLLSAASSLLLLLSCQGLYGGVLPVEKATSSSFQDDDEQYAPQNAVDGKEETRWSSKWTDDEWLCLDLGSVKSVDAIDLQWEAAYGKEYKIQVSVDGKTWTDAFIQKDGQGDHESIRFDSKQDVRYVRVFGVKRGTEYGYSLWEVKVLGSSKGSAAAPAAAAASDEAIPVVKTEASSFQDDDAQYAPQNAIDGKDDTRWSSKWTDDEWICFDLGSPKTISGLELFWETASGKEYKIQVSDDGKSWRDAFVQSDGKGDREAIRFDSKQTARYVRLLGVKRSTEYGYSLWEVKVLGSKSGKAN